MSTLPDVLGARPDLAPAGEASEQLDVGSPAAARANVGRLDRVRAWFVSVRWTLGVYLATRVLYLLISAVEASVPHKWTMWGQLSNWDGKWYWQLAAYGYPSHVSHLQTTLGFFPLYPLLIWPLAHVGFGHPAWTAYVAAGLVVSFFAGAAAVVLIGRLAESWWGHAASRRAVLLLCVFPGSVVFSMVYTEGLLLTLIAGCLYAMQRRRWLLAGLLAGLATAVGPIALAIIPACLTAALHELRSRGWAGGRRALLAPLLAPLGAVAFGAYLWLHTGSPFASFLAQRYGWHETSSPLALWHIANWLAWQVSTAPDWAHMTVNSNYVAGLIGAGLLLIAWVLLLRRPRIPLPSLIWTLGVTVLTFTSQQTPPNARLLLCGFPAVIVFAQRIQGRWFKVMIVLTALALIGMTWVTYVGVDLRP